MEFLPEAAVGAWKGCGAQRHEDLKTWEHARLLSRGSRNRGGLSLGAWTPHQRQWHWVCQQHGNRSLQTSTGERAGETAARTQWVDALILWCLWSGWLSECSSDTRVG